MQMMFFKLSVSNTVQGRRSRHGLIQTLKSIDLDTEKSLQKIALLIKQTWTVPPHFLLSFHVVSLGHKLSQNRSSHPICLPGFILFLHLELHHIFVECPVYCLNFPWNVFLMALSLPLREPSMWQSSIPVELPGTEEVYIQVCLIFYDSQKNPEFSQS